MVPLTLDPNDPAVLRAKASEAALFEHYGLEGADRYIFLSKHGIRLRVTEFGSGDPIAIVPGNTGDAFPITSLLQKLPGKRLIAINRPGGGLSEGIDHRQLDVRQFAAETLETVFDELELNSVDIVAHSMGAHWATLFALTHPQRVRRMALLGNPGNIMGGKPPAIVRLMGRLPFNRLMAKLILPKDKSQALRPLQSMGHSKESLAAQPQQLADAYFYFRLLPHYLTAATSLLENPMPMLQAQDLARLSQPTALLLGSRDNFASQDLGRKITTAMSNGQFYSIADAGHLPWLEAADECGRIILEFLSR